LTAGVHTSKEAGAYIDSLQKSIVAYCDNEQQENQKCWHYRGENLRPAIEKKLYFQLIDNQNLRSHFLQNGSISIKEHLASKATRGMSLRHVTRSIRSSIKTKVSIVSQSKIVALCTSEKHKAYCQQATQSENIEMSLYSEIVLTHESSAIPIKSQASQVLFKQHYDLLVYFEILHAHLNSMLYQTVVFIEGNTPQDYIGSIVAKSLKKKTVCLQFGWAFTVHLSFQNLNYDIFLAWGKPFSSILKDFSPNQIFADVGHPTLKKVASSGVNGTISFICQAPFRWIGIDTFNTFIETSILMAKLEWNVLIREHPSWPLDEEIKSQLIKQNNIQFIDNSKVSLQEQLANSTFAVTVFSSVGFESIITKTIPIFTLFDMDIDLKPGFTPSLNRLRFRSQKEFLQAFEEFKNHPNKIDDLKHDLSELSETLFPATGENARKNICAFIND
jgi:hypothetical protein